jgi:hypothetical protein
VSRGLTGRRHPVGTVQGVAPLLGQHLERHVRIYEHDRTIAYTTFQVNRFRLI